MYDFAKRTMVAALGAIVLGCAASVPAAAADIPVPQGAEQPPPPQYYGNQEYYAPPPARGYVYPAPPPVYYQPAPVAVVPAPYYGPYGYYGRPYYRARAYGPYFARGYGRFGHRRW